MSRASFSALKHSAWSPNRIKQFSTDDLLALSRGFDLPIGYLLTPPAPDFDAGLHAPDAAMNGLDAIQPSYRHAPRIGRAEPAVMLP